MTRAKVIEPFPAGRFATIVADPPWRIATYSVKGKGRSAEAYYDTMPLDQIMALPVDKMAVANAVLLLWTTDQMLRHAFEVIEAWGFEYKTVGFYWVKSREELALGPTRYFMGLGHWTRSNPEQCLLATRGHPHRKDDGGDVPKLIVSPRRIHSQKPAEIYRLIERLVPGPYLELFARDKSSAPPGWTQWMGKAASLHRRYSSSSYPGAPP